MWLGVEDEDINEARQLRVTVSAVEDWKGEKKRWRCQCKVILHGSSKFPGCVVKCGDGAQRVGLECWLCNGEKVKGGWGPDQTST